MRRRLGGDAGYAGNLVHNPEHGQWKVWQPQHVELYSLGDLADHVDLLAANDRQGTVEGSVGLGRNVTLFDQLRAWAYTAISHYWGPGGFDTWFESVLQHAMNLNTFLVPLPLSEIRATSRSVAKWVWSHITPMGRQALIERTHTSSQQAARGQRGGLAKGRSNRNKRIAALEMRGRGISTRRIAKQIGVSATTISRWSR